MAASKTYFPKPNYLGDMTGFVGSESVFELDESDVWNVSESPELRNSVPSSRISKKRSSSMAVKGGYVAGKPDWSKMVKEDYTENRRRYGDDDGYNGVEDRIPPHEFLAKTRIASFSVHEGIGWTLKGRDLSRVRDAIWKRTGFED